MTSEETLWDVEEVARYLKVSKDTIYRWLDTKKHAVSNGQMGAIADR